MRLMFVADGPRDSVTIPRIVERILNTPVEGEFQAWRLIRLRRGSGYKRKMQFALRRARDSDLRGVVATVDSDTDGPRDRLSMLRSARDEDRQSPRLAPIPAALGEAVPHLEAWLLDDPKAVREVLQLSSETNIPDVGKSDPKTSLNELMEGSTRTEGPIEFLKEIAQRLDIGRCNHASDTGFAEFVQDVRDELEPLVSASP